MSVVEFDQGTGRLRLPAPAFEALEALSNRRAPDRAGLTALEEAGVVRDGLVHPRVAPAAQVLADPVISGEVHLQEHTGRQIVGGIWVGLGGTVMLMSTRDEGVHEVLTVPTAHVAPSLARIVGLRPRPRLASDTMRLPFDMLDQLLSPEQQQRSEVVDLINTQVKHGGTRGFLGSVVDEPWWYWWVGLRWVPASADEESSRALHVVDTTGGLARIYADDEQAYIEPTTPTDVWTYLTMLLPTAGQVAGVPV